jgi:hypothetical protein
MWRSRFEITEFMNPPKAAAAQQCLSEHRSLRNLEIEHRSLVVDSTLKGGEIATNVKPCCSSVIFEV